MPPSPSVAIIGCGYGGSACARYFSSAYHIVRYDPAKGYRDRTAVLRTALAVVAVPTPEGARGHASLATVEEVLGWLQRAKMPVVLKSTVPPGTTNALAARFQMKDRLCFSPEFIGEGNYFVPYWRGYPHPTDMRQHEFFIFGGTEAATARVIPYFEKISGPFVRYLTCDAAAAELAKYAVNTWLATQVTYWNELYDLANVFEVPYRTVRELVLCDKRVSPAHSLVYAHARGFGGKCLPKDTRALEAAARQKGYLPRLLAAVRSANRRFRKASLQ